MPMSSELSRRSLIITTAIAATPVGAAKKKGKKKGKKNKPLVPLAFATAHILDIDGIDVERRQFQFSIQLGFLHPASNVIQIFGTNAEVAVDDAAAQLVAFVQQIVATNLTGLGHAVAAERVHVTLL